MTGTPQSRRDVLKGAVAIAAAASIGTTTAGRAHAQGSHAQARAQIDGVLRQAADAREVPGVVAMAATDKGVLYEGAFGVRALDQGPPMTLDTVFRIASMTKAITSVAAMQLVEQGKLKLEEPGAQHRSGAGLAPGARGLRRGRRAQAAPRQAADHAAPPADPHRRASATTCGTRTWGATSRRRGCPSRATGKLASIRTPLVFDPGDRWEYGVNTDWAGRLVEVAQRPDARRVLPRQDLRAARHEGQRLRRHRRAARAPGPRAPRQADGDARAPAAGSAPVANPEFWSGGGPLYSTGARLPRRSSRCCSTGGAGTARGC